MITKRKQTQLFVTLQSLFLKIETLSNSIESENWITFKLEFELEQKAKDKGFNTKPTMLSSDFYGCNIIGETISFMILKECGHMLQHVWELYDENEIKKSLKFDFTLKETKEFVGFNLIIPKKEHYTNFKRSPFFKEHRILFSEIRKSKDDYICRVTMSKNDISSFAMDIIDNDPLSFIDHPM